MHRWPSRASMASAVRTSLLGRLRVERPAPRRSTCALRQGRRGRQRGRRAGRAGKSSGSDLGQPGERQPQADRRIARHQEQVAALERPSARVTPAPAFLAGLARQQRQHVAGRRVAGPCSKTRISRSRSAGSASLLSSGLTPTRQLLLDQHEMRRILVGRHRAAGGSPSWRHELGGKPLGVGDCCRRLRRLRGDQRGIAPERLAVAAPVDGEGPARRLLARDTICPGRSAAGRPGRSVRAGGAPACRR